MTATTISDGPLLLLLLLLVAALLSVVHASVWDPHPVPTTPPFFEGFYMRATLFDATPQPQQEQSQPDTVAVLFGAAELPPPAPGQTPLPAVYVALLHGDSAAGITRVYEATPPLSGVAVTRRGRNVTTAPDWRTPPAFTWRAEGGGGAVSAVVEGRHMVLRVEAGAARLWCEVEVGEWVYDGGKVRPHSWTDVSDAVPLHWYIHALHSPVRSLRLDLPGPRTLQTRAATAHLEKNWGRRFPHAWLWTQGSARVTTHDSAAAAAAATLSFAFSYGAVGDDAARGPFTHFGHFRDEGSGLAWDFRPDNSILTQAEVDGCAGVARLVFHGFDAPVTLEDGSTHRPRRRLALDLRRPLAGAACLLGPTGAGFERLCEETFQAVCRVTATLDGRLLREATVERVALELGAGWLCNGTCGGGSALAGTTTTAAAVVA